MAAGGRDLSPRPLGQFVTEADAWQTDGPGLELRYRLAFEGAKPFTHPVSFTAPIMGLAALLGIATLLTRLRGSQVTAPVMAPAF